MLNPKNGQTFRKKRDDNIKIAKVLVEEETNSAVDSMIFTRDDQQEIEDGGQDATVGGEQQDIADFEADSSGAERESYSTRRGQHREVR